MAAKQGSEFYALVFVRTGRIEKESTEHCYGEVKPPS